MKVKEKRKNIGNVKNLRDSKGSGQKYTVEQLGGQQNTYNKIWNDETKMSREWIERIADILETIVEVLKEFDERVAYIRAYL